MKEKLESLKESKFNKVALKKDVENKERELDDAEWTLKSVLAEKINVAEELEVFKKISKVMLDNYGRVPSKIENLWEGTDEFIILMKEKQLIDNRRKIAEFEAKARSIDNKIYQTNNNIEGLKQSLEMVKEELEDKKDE